MGPRAQRAADYDGRRRTARDHPQDELSARRLLIRLIALTPLYSYSPVCRPNLPALFIRFSHFAATSSFLATSHNARTLFILRLCRSILFCFYHATFVCFISCFCALGFRDKQCYKSESRVSGENQNLEGKGRVDSSAGAEANKWNAIKGGGRGKSGCWVVRVCGVLDQGASSGQRRSVMRGGSKTVVTAGDAPRGRRRRGRRSRAVGGHRTTDANATLAMPDKRVTAREALATEKSHTGI